MYKITTDVLIGVYLKEEESEDVLFFEECLKEVKPELNSELCCYLGYKVEQELESLPFYEKKEKKKEGEVEEED